MKIKVGEYYKYIGNSVIMLTELIPGWDEYKYDIIQCSSTKDRPRGRTTVLHFNLAATHLPGYGTPLWELLND
jgi:hypothetical protein